MVQRCRERCFIIVYCARPAKMWNVSFSFFFSLLNFKKANPARSPFLMPQRSYFNTLESSFLKSVQNIEISDQVQTDIVALSKRLRLSHELKPAQVCEKCYLLIQ
jgi:hypothetical protein